MSRRFSSFLNTAGSSIGGAVIGGFVAHILNPALTHIGIPPIADVYINSMSAAGGGALGKHISEVTAEAWTAFEESKRRKGLAVMYAGLLKVLTNVRDSNEMERLYHRAEARMHEYHSGLLTTSQMAKKLEEVYDDYLIAVGEKPVSRRRRS